MALFSVWRGLVRRLLVLKHNRRLYLFLHRHVSRRVRRNALAVWGVRNVLAALRVLAEHNEARPHRDVRAALRELDQLGYYLDRGS